MRFIISFVVALSLAFAASAFAGERALAAPAGTDATIAGLNAKGVDAYNQGDLGGALTYFKSAVKMDGDFAVGQYNIAIVLDAQGKHEKAAAHFGVAKSLAPNNKDIQDSAILAKHLK